MTQSILIKILAGLIIIIAGGSFLYITNQKPIPPGTQDERAANALDDFDQEEEITQNTSTQSSEALYNEEKVNQDNKATAETSLLSKYLGPYALVDEHYGTDVKVTLTSTERIITSNALPNHETGNFPNSGNPNSIAEQNNTYTYPLFPTWVGNARDAREPGVAINGIKFEPETAERVTCSSGESYQIEAFQDFANLGFDFNNAHVQPDGTYHYHGVPESLVDAFESNDDLVHVGFAADGYLMYYSKSNAYKPSYLLSNTPRIGTACTYRQNTVAIQNSTPDGTYVSDWVYDAGLGDLDECNGITINGQYSYLITEDYPYVSRCLNGSFTETAPTGPPPGGNGGQLPPPPGANSVPFPPPPR